MNNFMSIDKLKEKVNYALINFKTNTEIHPYRDIWNSARRLAQLALTIPEGEFIGIEASYKGKNLSQNYMFSSKNAGVSKTDFDWIIQELDVKCDQMFEEDSDYRFFAGREVYMIHMDPNFDEDQKVEVEDEYSDPIYSVDLDSAYVKNALLTIGEEHEAHFRYYAFSKGNNTFGSCILASFPQEMSLRERAAYALAFPYHMIIKLEDIRSFDEIRLFSQTAFLTSITEADRKSVV